MTKKTVVVIPARGGSTGIPDKNIRDFAGKPLIAWTIELALAANGVSRVIVSTDSERIAEVARKYGAEVPFLRPSDIAEAKTPIEPVMAHTWHWLKDNENYVADALVLLFPTNPLRKRKHLEECIKLYYSQEVDSVLTVNESPAHYTPYWTLVRDAEGVVRYFSGEDIRSGYTRRQDFPQKCYAKNDLVFVIRPENLFQQESSLYGRKVELIITERIYDGDINDPEDWELTLQRFLMMNSVSKNETKNKINKYHEKIIKRITESKCLIEKILVDISLQKKISEAAEVCTKGIEKGNKILLAGNGGSAADAQHIAGELVSRFMIERPGLPAIALTTDTSILTAIGNDYGYENIFARQIQALGNQGDILIAYSTSGNSKNIINGLKEAKEKNIHTIGMTGNKNGLMCNHCDILLEIPSDSTPKIQEGHLILGHLICEIIENNIFNN